MLRDLTQSDWQGLLKISDDRLPTALILRGTRALKDHYAQMRAFFSDVLDIGDPNVVVDDVFLGRLGDIPVAYASVYGAPMASEIVHLFGVLGARLVLQIGCCGSLTDRLLAGDLFAASSAYCGEGASQYYKENGKEVAATIGFADLLDPEEGHTTPVAGGRLYSTSALFAESRRDITRWAAQGFDAVDMETAATFAVAEHFGMDRASLLYVYDCPSREEHIFQSDMEQNRRRRQGNQRMIRLALQTVIDYGRGEIPRVGPTS